MMISQAKELKQVLRDVVIIGSGPAGLTAAIYTARANLKPLLIEGLQAGGQLMITTMVENYPAFPEGLLGPDLIKQTRAQAERFGTEFMTGDVTKVELSKSPFELHLDSAQETVKTKTLIISSGASARLLGLPSEMRLMGRGTSTCATCDGYFFREKEIVVVGGGDTAFEEAIFLTKFALKVTLIHRRDQFRASKIMQDRAKSNPKITFLLDTIVEEILGDEIVQAVQLKNVKTGDRAEMKCSGVFIAIGHDPNTKLFANQIHTDESGYIITQNGTETNKPGVFAAGDVQDHRYRQAITAAGSGCMAAMDAEKYLESLS